MGRYPQQTVATFRMPRGYAGLWQIIRDLDKKGAWTIADVFAETNMTERRNVTDYVHRLVRGGFAKLVEQRPTVTGGDATKIYRLLKKPADAPVLRRDGTLLGLPAQQRMWNAIRSLKQFGRDELALVAASEKGPVAAETVKRYCNHLTAAGYLISEGERSYRLKRSMDSGPRAPMILRLHVVWDANRAEVVGDQREAEAVS